MKSIVKRQIFVIFVRHCTEAHLSIIYKTITQEEQYVQDLDAVEAVSPSLLLEGSTTYNINILIHSYSFSHY